MMETSDRLIRALQWVWVGFAFFLVGGIIIWIVHLIRTSWSLDDTLSASIGISLVAIPIFLVFMGVVFYVFWGVAVHGRER
ncbi:MAG: hypothetical protein A3F90_20575 [Deltaproteobacteria bacterium RIFCSPLOWO2_12_FULL_60_19]|nr:MAG: hypothetical protein A3F90_20575 [Deltaproteobacteria bacterium RIFCSPLOWO2_12_FULL_60_19]